MFAYFYAFLFKRKTIQWGLGQIKGRNKSTIRKILDPIIEFLERTSNACLAYSSIGKLYYANIGVTSEKTFVAVNVVDTELRKHEIKRLDRAQIYTDSHSTSRFNVLFVGAMEKTKRVDILISAFSRLETKYHSAVSLTLVGDGVERKNLQTLSEKLGVKNVRFVGKTMEGVNKYFLGADVFVLPGLGGLAVSDAMVHGLPVIASIGDGCEKDLLSCGAGIIDEGLDEQSLFEHLDRIYQNPAELSKMRRDAIKTIDSKYNIENYIANIERCIDYAYTH
jgi:glycosyltransferase involved in cell wall biosynthesis